MSHHITTIQFDATTFNADDSLIKLLGATSHYNELSHKNILIEFFFKNKLHHNFGDSSGKSFQQHSHLITKLLQLFSLAQTIAKPEAFYCTEHHNTIPLPANFSHTFPVYPFIATVGQQFDTWCNHSSSMTDRYCAHIIGMWLLHKCVQKLASTLECKDNCCVLYPGSVDELPLTYNRTVYVLFENEALQTGITINDECMFSPLHTVAGFILPHAGQKNCAACRLQQCQFRNILT